MDTEAKLTYEEYLDIIFGNTAITVDVLNKLDYDLLENYKTRADISMKNFREFNVKSKFSKDDSTYLERWIKIEKQQQEQEGHI